MTESKAAAAMISTRRFEITAAIDLVTLRALRYAATRRAFTIDHLVGELVTKIIADNLVDAVLDDGKRARK